MTRRRKRIVAPRPAVWALLGALACAAPAARAQDRLEFFEYPRELLEKHRPPNDSVPRNGWTFCRISYTSVRGKSGGPWWTDFPGSDDNFSRRLGELTMIDVNPPVWVKITDPRMFDYPMIYMLEIGTLEFQPDEIEPLRKYLLGGGFLLVDDNWGVREWQNWVTEISRVFPPEEFPMAPIPLDHELFHCVFDLREVPQVPGIQVWRSRHVSYEREDAKQAECWGIHDRKGRLMVVAMHNTDLGDGWECEGDDPVYFREFSAKKAYPMGVNIVVYAMTH